MKSVQNLLSLNIPQNTAYAIFAGCAYGCIAVVFILALVFGTRGLRGVKKEEVTSLPEGLSPLDVSRIFKGKTVLGGAMTRALITWWAQCGYITVKPAGENSVKINKKIRRLPFNTNKDAVFYDRGVYVRERDIFDKVFGTKESVTVRLFKPLLKRSDVNFISKEIYAVREDEGVFSNRHYNLKILTLFLSIAPFFISAGWACVYQGQPVALITAAFSMIGFFVLKFVRGMPVAFKILWCGLWLGASVGTTFAFGVQAYDPLGMVYATTIMLFFGSFVIIRFVDYRTKINLKDYSMLVNYKKYLKSANLSAEEYYAALPFIYIFRIKPFVKNAGKFAAPEWYRSGSGEGGKLL